MRLAFSNCQMSPDRLGDMVSGGRVETDLGEQLVDRKGRLQRLHLLILQSLAQLLIDQPDFLQFSVGVLQFMFHPVDFFLIGLHLLLQLLVLEIGLVDVRLGLQQLFLNGLVFLHEEGFVGLVFARARLLVFQNRLQILF